MIQTTAALRLASASCRAAALDVRISDFNKGNFLSDKPVKLFGCPVLQIIFLQDRQPFFPSKQIKVFGCKDADDFIISDRLFLPGSVELSTVF